MRYEGIFSGLRCPVFFVKAALSGGLVLLYWGPSFGKDCSVFGAGYRGDL